MKKYITLILISVLLWARASLEGDYSLITKTSNHPFIDESFYVSNRDIKALYLDINYGLPNEIILNGEKIWHLRDSCLNDKTIDLTSGVYLLKIGVNSIVLVNKNRQEIQFRLRGSKYSWWCGVTHCHSTYSDGAHSVSWDLNEVNNQGGHFLSITDHNTLAQCSDTGWHQTGNVLPMRGTEWTTDSGHACIVGIQGNNSLPTPVPIFNMINEATYRGGFIVINHPTDLNMEWDHFPLLDAGIDAIEVFNGPWSFPKDSTRSDQASVDWWQGLLAQGKTITAIAASDFHNDLYQDILDPCIRVYAPSNDIDTVLKYMKVGRVMLTRYVDHPQVYLYADSDNNGTFDKIIGDIINLSSTMPIKFRIEVYNAEFGYKVWLFNKNGRFQEFTYISNPWIYEWIQNYSPQDTNFVRVEVRRLDDHGRGFTNPIYINHKPYELGPINLVVRTFALPESITPPQADTIHLRLVNNGPLTPHQYGVHFSVDTSEFRILSFQTSGYGIGSCQHGDNWDGYEWVEWYGGYNWNNYFPIFDTIKCWVVLTPRSSGVSRIFYRCWATDRIYIVNRDPNENQGAIGAGGYWCWCDTIFVPISICENNREPSVGLVINLPNPVKNRLSVVFSNPTKNNIELKIYNVLGAIVLDKNLKPGITKFDLPLMDNSGNKIAGGIYFLILKDQNRQIVKKFVVVK